MTKPTSLYRTTLRNWLKFEVLSRGFINNGAWGEDKWRPIMNVVPLSPDTIGLQLPCYNYLWTCSPNSLMEVRVSFDEDEKIVLQ